MANTTETANRNDTANVGAEAIIRVHVLSEYVFCTRAGLETWEKNDEDRGWEEPILRWDYLPLYDLREIGEHLNAHLSALWRLVYICTAIVAATVVLALFVHQAFIWGGLGALAILFRDVYREVRDILTSMAPRSIRAGRGPRA